MATSIGPAGTASQIINIPPTERKPDVAQPEPGGAEQTPATEPDSQPRREPRETDSNIGNNIDTTA